MYTRLLQPPKGKSFFLFGPRATGKSTWVRDRLRDAVYLDLLESDVYAELLASPQRLEAKVPPGFRGWVILDDVQRVPEILHEVHQLVENRKLRFALTGSSARNLRRRGVNLLAGRALTLPMHPLSVQELGADFDLRHSLRFGQLPSVYVEENPGAFLSSYIRTYLREEVQQEGLTRNLGAFSRFLEAASFSQASLLNVSAVSRECHVERKVVEDYFSILEDLMLAVRVPVFTKRAKRRTVTHPKFYFFDAGVYRALRPRGPLDSSEDLDGAAAETLFFQEIRALNETMGLGYDLHFWRTRGGLEVDFVLYGERGLRAFDVKRSSRVRTEDLDALRVYVEDYPVAEAWLAYGGTRSYREGKIRIVPLDTCLRRLPELLSPGFLDRHRSARIVGSHPSVGFGRCAFHGHRAKKVRFATHVRERNAINPLSIPMTSSSRDERHNMASASPGAGVQRFSIPLRHRLSRGGEQEEGARARAHRVTCPAPGARSAEPAYLPPFGSPIGTGFALGSTACGSGCRMEDRLPLTILHSVRDRFD